MIALSAAGCRPLAAVATRVAGIVGKESNKLEEVEARLGHDPASPHTDGDVLTDVAAGGFEPGSSTGTDRLRHRGRGGR